MNTVKEQIVPSTRITVFVQQWSVLLYFGTLAILCALEVALGALPTRVYAHDLFIFLDGAWRLACGQIPSRDFYSGHGVLVWTPLRWGLALYGYSPDSIGLVRAFYTAAIGVWFFLLTRLIPRQVLWAVPGLFLLVFVSAARPLGEHPTWVSHSMFYNRVAHGLLCLIVFERLGSFRSAAIDRRASEQPGDRVHFWGGVSTGAALVLVSLVQVSFAVPAIILVATGLYLFGAHRRQLTGLLSGALAALAFAVAFLHLDPAAFLHEAFTLNQQRGSISGAVIGTLVDELGEFVFTLAAGVAAAWSAFANPRIAYNYVIATVAIAACDLYCRATGSMNGDLPLSAFWCLSGCVLLLSLAAGEAEATARRQRMIALLVVCPLALPLFVNDSASTAYAVFKTAALRRHATVRFNSPLLRSWTPQDWLGADPNFVSRNGQQLISVTNEGIQLLQHLSHPEETVSCIAYANPFSFALGRRPAPGGTPTISLTSGFAVTHPLPEKTLIGRPDLLMVERPNFVEEPTTNAVLGMYPDLLTKEFVLAGSSPNWTLYRRRQ